MFSSNLLFMMLIILGPIMSISCSSWLTCWAGIEITFLGLIPLMFMGTNNMSGESAIKYFILQALASALLFFSGSTYFLFNINSELINYLMLISLMLKLGLFPGHFWVPGVCISSSWLTVVMILGPIKIAPWAIFSTMNNNSSLIMLMGGLSALMGGIMGNNQTNIRAVIGCSSISHSGWMALGLVTGGLWLYMFLYMAILFIFSISMIYNLTEVMALSMLSMSGLPPFLMFVSKFYILDMMMNSYSWVFLICPVIGAILSLMFYLKFFYSFYLNMKKGSFFYISLFLSFNMFGVMWMFFCGRFKL